MVDWAGVCGMSGDEETDDMGWSATERMSDKSSTNKKIESEEGEVYTDLYNKLKILKHGSNDDNFPLCSKYLHIENDKLCSCNGDIFISIDHDSDFKGDTNIFILDNILSMFHKNNDLNIIQNSNKLIIKVKNYSTKLPLVDVDFPILNKPDINYHKLDEDIINIFKLAINFTSSNISITDCIYVNKDTVCSSNAQKCFLYRNKDMSFDTVGISRKILSLLSDEVSIGADKLNTVLSFDSGYAVFSTYNMGEYPVIKLADLVNKIRNNSHYICNIAHILDTVEKLRPIFYKEKEQFVTLMNAGNKLSIVASSELNGESVVEIDSHLDRKFIMSIELSKFRNIPISFDFYVTIDDSKKGTHLYLKDNLGSEIVILGD